jgi:hypothetical protein
MARPIFLLPQLCTWIKPLVSLWQARSSKHIDHKAIRPGFAERFVVYMLDDRAILWEFFQRTNQPWLNPSWTFRDWTERYTSFSVDPTS